MSGKIAGYARVSTADQNLDRQLTKINDYADRALDADLADLEIYRDKSTGTNTDRSGYQKLVDDAEAGDLSAVVVGSVSRICRSIADLQATAERLEAAGVELHIVDEGLTLRPGETDPYQQALFQLLGVFAELEANMAQQRTREGIAARQESDDYHHGKAPLGFAKNDGALVQGENYHDVVSVLDMIQKDEISKRQAAKELDTSRRTIDRALESGELYGIGGSEQ